MSGDDRIRWVLADGAVGQALAPLRPGESGRRGYATVCADGEKLFVKAFRERGLEGMIRQRLAPRGKAEFDLGRRLIQRGVPTPEPLGYGIAKRHSFVVQRHLDGQSLLEALNDEERRPALFQALARFLNLLKEAGVRHNDLHLDNILLAHDGLYLIDLHSARIERKFNEGDELSNLSHALAMHYRTMTDAEKEGFFEAYGSQRLRRDLENRITEMEERWVASKAKRALAATSEISVRGAYVCLGDESPAETPTPGTILKKDRKVVVERFGTYVAKTYSSRRRLLRAWRAHVILHYMGLSVTPRAYWMKKAAMGSRGFIAMEDLGGAGEELDRFLDGRYKEMGGRERRLFLQSLALFLRTLLARRIIHRDMKACNIFVVAAGGYRLLDVEDILFAEADEAYYVRLMVQLNTTIPRAVADRDRIRFLALLLNGDRQYKRRVLDEVRRRSLASDIVYEGLSGLRVEDW